MTILRSTLIHIMISTYSNLHLRQIYKQLAEEHRYRNRKVVTPADMPTSLDLFDEDVHNAMDEYGHIVRKDMFKGSAV